MFKTWLKSMALRYYIDAFFIIAISIYMQLYIINFSTTATSYYDIVDEYNTKKALAQDTSLSAADQATAKAQFSVVENEFLRINNRAYDQQLVLYYLWMLLTAYWLRNISQIIYAKLRNKSYNVIIGEFILSCIHVFIVVLAVFRHYV